MVFNIDLEDGKEPVSFQLNEEKAERFIEFMSEMNGYKKKIDKSVEMAIQYGGIDGSHHKDWVIDQMVRELTDDLYEKVVKDACDGEDGPDTYFWECGIAP